MGFAFGNTITGGIQDVSALLPLLGTEQCEEHIGSALIDGYVYASAASLSIFGSLGIALAGLKALVASIVFSGWNDNRIMGAAKLADAGFGPTGKVLSQIMWDGKCHAVETRLTATLEQLHIKNAEKLSVKGVSRQWIVAMMLASILTFVASLAPYVYLIKNNHNDPVSVRWFFPFARSAGSIITSNMVQIIIRTRILAIVKHRIAFLTLDDLVRSRKIVLPHWWDTQRSSEVALHHLRAHLKKAEAEPPINPEDRNALLDKLDSTNKHHLSLPRSQRMMLFAAQLSVACGIVLTPAGYVGCFSLVQNSASFGPLIWLVTEIALSLLRMAFWSWNPDWDETGTSLVLELELARKSPLPTCNKFSEELDEEHIVPLTHPREFLEKITSYVGLLEPFRSEEDGIALYYALTGNERGERVLYVTILDYKANISRTLVRSKDPEPVCRIAKLGVEDGEENNTGYVWATMGEEMSMSSSYITKDGALVKGLLAHCDSILYNLNARECRTADIKMTWALTQILDTTETTKLPSPQVLSQLTEDDMTYLRVGKLERYRRTLCLERSRWVDGWISLIKGDFLEGLLQAPQSFIVLYEVAVAEYLILHEWEDMERMLVEETRQLESILWQQNANLIDELGDSELQGLRERMANMTAGIEAEQTRNRNRDGYLQSQRESAIIKNIPYRRRKIYDVEHQALTATESYDSAAREASEQHVRALEMPNQQLTEPSLAELQDQIVALEHRRVAALSRDLAVLKRDLVAQQMWKATIEREISAERKMNAMRRVTVEAERVRLRLTKLGAEARARVKERRFRGPTEQILKARSSDMERTIRGLWDSLIDDVRKDQLKGGDVTVVVGRDCDFTKLDEHTRESIESIEDRSKKREARREFLATQAKWNARRERVMTRLSYERHLMETRLEKAALTANGFIKECKDFNGSLFVAHLMLSKFVELSRAMVNETGVAAITKALGRNTVASCVNCSECSLDETILIIRSLQKPRSVTLILPESLDENDKPKLGSALKQYRCGNILSLNLSLKEISQPPYRACLQAVEENRNAASSTSDNKTRPLVHIYYEGVKTSDTYRRGEPSYLLFSSPDSKCVVKFAASDATRSAPADEAEPLTLRLNHCCTNTNGKVDIRMNGINIPWDQDKCPQ